MSKITYEAKKKNLVYVKECPTVLEAWRFWLKYSYYGWQLRRLP